MKQKIDKVLDRVIEACGAVSDAAYRARSVHVWHSADGRVTPITEMDDRWLANAIGCVERGKASKATHTRVLPFMRAELMRRQNERHPMRVVNTDGPQTITIGPGVRAGDVIEVPPRPHLPGLASVAERVRALENKLAGDSWSPLFERVRKLEVLLDPDGLTAKRVKVAHDRLDKQADSLRNAHNAINTLESRLVSVFARMHKEGSSSKWRNTTREILTFMRTGAWE